MSAAPGRPRFRRVDRDQLFMLPPSVWEWLPVGHPAKFVVTVVSELDLSRFERAYRSTVDRGRPAYHPEVMVGVCLYAAMCAVNSSRQIAKHLVTDVGFRVVAANEQPDHSTISRFLIRHAEALRDVFAQVVVLGSRAGVLDPTVVALDGTSLAASASKSRNVTLGRLREQFGAWADEVNVNDAADQAAEDAAAKAAKNNADGDSRHSTGGDDDGSPRPLNDDDEMREWVRAQLSDRVDEPDDARVNLTDPDSALMLRKGGGWLQGYNMQAAAVSGGLVVACEVTAAPGDNTLLDPMVKHLNEAVQASSGTSPAVVVADAGYWSTDSIDAINADDELPDVLVPPHSRPPDTPPEPLEEPDLDTYNAAMETHRSVIEAERERRAVVIARVVNRELLLREAAPLLGMSVATISRLQLEWIAAGGAHGISTGRHTQPPRPRGPTRAARAGHAMETRLTRPAGRSIYRQRKGIIEPVFGDIKTNRRITRFLRRGLDKVRTDAHLVFTGHNLTIIHRAKQAQPKPAPAKA